MFRGCWVPTRLIRANIGFIQAIHKEEELISPYPITCLLSFFQTHISFNTYFTTKERPKWGEKTYNLHLSGGAVYPIEETRLYAYISCIKSLSSPRLKTGLLNFGVRLQESRHNMAGYFGFSWLLLYLFSPLMDNNSAYLILGIGPIFGMLMLRELILERTFDIFRGLISWGLYLGSYHMSLNCFHKNFSLCPG